MQCMYFYAFASKYLYEYMYDWCPYTAPGTVGHPETQVCMYACMYVYVCLYILSNVYMCYVCMHKSLLLLVFVYMYIHVWNVCMHAYFNVCMYICTSVWIYLHMSDVQKCFSTLLGHPCTWPEKCVCMCACMYYVSMHACWHKCLCMYTHSS